MKKFNNSVANAATVGTITIPWMIKSGWSKEIAATINTGNSGSGQSFPASSAMLSFLKETRGNIATVGGIFLFAMAGSSVLSKVGFGDDLNVLIQNLSLPKIAVVFLIGIAVSLVAGPLSGVATTVAMGPVTYSVLTGIGISPIAAVAAFLIWMSTEGASPPSSSPIFMSCGLAGVKDVQKIFKPLIFHYVIPVVCVGALIALGIIPIAR